MFVDHQPQLPDVSPGHQVVERSSMNSWDDPGFRKGIEAAGRKNIIMTGLWTEVCVTWPTIEMLGAGYHMYVVEDGCGRRLRLPRRRPVFHAWCKRMRCG